MTREKVLVIASHPDDEVLGCGAVIAKHVTKGCQFCVLVLGEGISCRYLDINDPEIPIIIEQRRLAFKAMSILGVEKTEVCQYKCGRFDQYP